MLSDIGPVYDGLTSDYHGSSLYPMCQGMSLGSVGAKSQSSALDISYNSFLIKNKPAGRNLRFH